MVERTTLTRQAGGSNPSAPANLKCPRCGVAVPWNKVLQQDRCLVKPSCPLNDIVADWYTVAPKYRTVEHLLEKVEQHGVV